MCVKRKRRPDLCLQCAGNCARALVRACAPVRSFETCKPRAACAGSIPARSHACSREPWSVIILNFFLHYSCMATAVITIVHPRPPPPPARSSESQFSSFITVFVVVSSPSSSAAASPVYHRFCRFFVVVVFSRRRPSSSSLTIHRSSSTKGTRSRIRH